MTLGFSRLGNFRQKPQRLKPFTLSRALIARLKACATHGAGYNVVLPGFTPCATRSHTSRAAFTALTTLPEKCGSRLAKSPARIAYGDPGGLFSTTRTVKREPRYSASADAGTARAASFRMASWRVHEIGSKRGAFSSARYCSGIGSFASVVVQWLVFLADPIASAPSCHKDQRP